MVEEIHEENEVQESANDLINSDMNELNNRSNAQANQTSEVVSNQEQIAASEDHATVVRQGVR